MFAWRAGVPFDYYQINFQEYLKLLVRAAGNVLSPVGVRESVLARLVAVDGQYSFVEWDISEYRVLQETGKGSFRLSEFLDLVLLG